ncbi:(2Fe-2S)-binding protein [Streptomyces albiaxialis]|uniref:(2Fe-2S)-binding protein n=1 Tax=Streptomyces albiaxialis TaxID=329523 RepID=A0ABP5IE90_9ACTN
MTTAPAPALATPLPRTYGRIIATCEALDARLVPAHPEGRPDGAALARDEDALDAWIEAEAARIRNRHGHEPRLDVAASRTLHTYLWSVGLLIAGPWYLERRVPRLAPHEVALDLDPAADVFEIAPGTDFACLPDDPAAAAPGARVVAHEEALRAELRSAVADHVRPLLTAVAPRVRRRSRALWGMASDDLVSAIWHVGRVLGRERHAAEEATRVLPSPVPPFPGGAAFRDLPGTRDRAHLTRTRLGCCMYYTLAAAEACVTCPRTCDTERLRRLEDED